MFLQTNKKSVYVHRLLFFIECILFLIKHWQNWLFSPCLLLGHCCVSCCTTATWNWQECITSLALAGITLKLYRVTLSFQTFSNHSTPSYISDKSLAINVAVIVAIAVYIFDCCTPEKLPWAAEIWHNCIFSIQYRDFNVLISCGTSNTLKPLPWASHYLFLIYQDFLVV